MLARTGQQQQGEQREVQVGSDLRRVHDALLAAVLESAPDCVIVMDAQGAVVDLNPAVERTFGYRREEMLGRELAALVVPPSLRERHRRGVQRLEEGGAGAVAEGGMGAIVGRRVELTAMRADGSEFPVELTVTRVSGEPALYAGLVHDATEQRRVTE